MTKRIDISKFSNERIRLLMFALNVNCKHRLKLLRLQIRNLREKKTIAYTQKNANTKEKKSHAKEKLLNITSQWIQFFQY